MKRAETPAERILKLARYLQEEREVSRRQITDALDSYDATRTGDAGLRQQLGRDLITLRDSFGILVDYDPSDDRYRIQPPFFTSEERRALLAAAATVTVEGLDGSPLGELGTTLDDQSARVVLSVHRLVSKLRDAIATRTPVQFLYHGTMRTVEPYAMASAKNRWYLRGWEREAERRNTYRLDKIDETADVPIVAPAGDAASFEIPSDFDPAAELRLDPNQWGHDPLVVAQLHIEPSHLAAFLHEFDATIVQATGGDVDVEVRDRASFIRRLLGFRGRARLLSPPDLVADVRAWLESQLETALMPPLKKEDHFKILMAVTALIEEREEITLADAATAVGLDAEVLRQRLEPLLYLEFKVGGTYIIDASREFYLDPVTDVLRLEERGQHWLRNLRATPPDNDSALRLLLSGMIYQATDRAWPALASALDKLSEYVSAELVLPVTVPRWLAVVEDANRRMRSVRMLYLGHGKDAPSEREVLPWKLYSRWNQWYFDGPEVGDTIVKHWKVVHILEAEVGTIDFDPPPEIEVPELFDLEHLRRAFTVIAPQSMLDALPQPCRIEDSVPEPDGRIRATISVMGDHRVDHVLVCLGPEGEVVDPPELVARRQQGLSTLLDQVV